MHVGGLDLGIVNYYVCANVLVVAAATILAGIGALSGILARPLTYRHLVGLGRVLTVAALLLPVLTVWHGGNELAPLRAQVWSAPTMLAAGATIPHSARIELGFASQLASLPLDAVTSVILIVFAAGLFVGLVPLVSEARATYRAIRDAHVLRRVGRVRLLISDKV